MLERLNVVYVADIPQTGGASASLFDLVVRMSRDYGAQCSVLFPCGGPLKKKLDDAGIRTFVTGHRGFLVPRPSSDYKVAPKFAIELARYHASRRLAIQRAESQIDFSQVDLIHSNLPRNDLGIDLARRHGVPHICHLREFSFEDFRCWSYRRHPAQYLSAGTDRFIAVSRACARAWAERGVEPDKVRVVYNGIDIERFAGGSSGSVGRERNGGGLRLVFLGGCSEPKGVWDAVEAMRLLPPSMAGRISLDVYGGGSGSIERKVRKFISDNRLEGRVALCGPCDDVAGVLPRYDCGLVCSQSEAFGRVVVEYQAAGLAVVGANGGSLPELLDGGRKGVLYDRGGGPIELAAAITALALEEGCLERLKEHGPTYAGEYSLDKTVGAVAKLYEEVLASPTG